MVTEAEPSEHPLPRPVDQAELLDLCQSYTPRRFAACEVSPDGLDARVLGFGISTDGGGVLIETDNASTWLLDSPDGVVALMGRRRDVRLVWLDPENPDANANANTNWPEHEDEDPGCASA